MDSLNKTHHSHSVLVKVLEDLEGWVPRLKINLLVVNKLALHYLEGKTHLDLEE